VTRSDSPADRILVLTPTGRDGEIVCHRLRLAGHACEVCPDLQTLVAGLPGAGAAVVAQEAINQAGAAALLAALEAQAPWSDVPILLLTFALTKRVPHAHAVLALFERANVTLFQRPLQIPLFVSAVGSAVRARRRQYQMRDLHSELERALQLTTTLKEREVLIQEIHHRVKNNLQMISSLINMQVRRLSDQTCRDALEECQTRVQAIALIHEKLYQSRDYARVPFSEYVRSLAANIFHTMGVSPTDISLDLEIEDLALAVDKAIPCGLALNELITNALKHAFPSGRRGTIRVELSKREEGMLRLVVKDDGVGLPAGTDIRLS